MIKLGRHESEATDFVTTTRPGRGAALEPDVWVPALQGALPGVAVGLGGGLVVLLLGGTIADLRAGQLWAWSGRIGGVVGVLTWAVATVLLIVDHRKLLWALETATGLDFDSEDQVGAPSVVRVELQREGPGQRPNLAVRQPLLYDIGS